MSEVPRTPWPPLPLREWQETQVSLQLRAQMLGKTRLALSPPQNHWWHTALYVTARGVGTSPMPYGSRSLEIDFDFIDHVLVFKTNAGDVRTLPLRPQSIAEFYQDYMAALRSLGMDVRIWPVPSEFADPIPFPNDRGHSAYDSEAVERYFQVLSRVDSLLKTFRGRFLGKSSPSHVWWGGLDIACTRFSGRPAPQHPGGIPNLPDAVTREAYSHECISAGWWHGIPGGPVPDAAFYAYAYPEPSGCSAAPIRPPAARYDLAMREWILPYQEVTKSDDPEAMVLEFLQSTYDAAAKLGSWSADLERPLETKGTPSSTGTLIARGRGT